ESHSDQPGEGDELELQSLELLLFEIAAEKGKEDLGAALLEYSLLLGRARTGEEDLELLGLAFQPQFKWLPCANQVAGYGPHILLKSLFFLGLVFRQARDLTRLGIDHQQATQMRAVELECLGFYRCEDLLNRARRNDRMGNRYDRVGFIELLAPELFDPFPYLPVAVDPVQELLGLHQVEWLLEVPERLFAQSLLGDVA